jgi:glycosyltransferase involved in cell wall biosynthesis
MDERTKPLVSVIIPTHNRLVELSRALDSVLKQTLSSLEVFVLDDASTEDVQGAVRKITDNRVNYIRNDQKTNANVMRNIGITEARGIYMAFLDSDDEWLPDHLEKKIAYLEQYHVDMVFGSSFVDNGSGRVFAVSREIMDKEHPVNYVLGNGFAQTSGWVLKSKCAMEVRFDETLFRHQDYDFFIRYALKFKVKASWEPTTVIHWKKGVPRLKNIDSEKQFIKQYETNLDKRLLCEYLFERYYAWKNAGVSDATAHYRKRLMDHIPFITFNQFRQLFGNNSAFTLPVRLLHFMTLIVLYTLRTNKLKP